MGVGENSILLIEATIHFDCSSYYICSDFTSQAISICRGVRQGCPLSMLLFNIGINPILNSLDLVVSGGLMIAEHRISCMAYADDLVLLASNTTAMQELTDKAVLLSAAVNLKFKSAKCAHLRVPHRNKGSSIKIDDTTLANIDNDSTYSYLGVNFGEKFCDPPAKLFLDIISHLNKIKNSILFPWQKIHAYVIFLHSKTIFAFRNFYIKNFYSLEGLKTSVDRQLRKILKSILGLPPNASNKYLYCPRAAGGVGLRSLADEYLIQSIGHCYQMLASPDATTSASANFSLIRAASGIGIIQQTNLSNALCWLNKGDSQLRTQSWWTKIRSCVTKLKLRHSIRLTFCINANLICIKVAQTLSTKHSYHGIVTPADRKGLSKILGNLISRSWQLQWLGQRSVGRHCSALTNSRASTTIIYNGKISIAAWHFIHRARTYSLQTKDRHASKDKSCRCCNNIKESQMHVFVECSVSGLYIMRRHNEVQNIIADSIKINTDAIIYVNVASQYCSSALRVDLQIQFNKFKQIFLVDIKCPYDTSYRMKRAHELNIEHYIPLANIIRQALPDWTISLHTIVVGCLGSWAKGNDSVLRQLHLSKTAIHLITTKCIASNIYWSTAQWHFHQGHINSTTPSVAVQDSLQMPDANTLNDNNSMMADLFGATDDILSSEESDIEV